MVSVRHEPAKHEITGHALLQLDKLIDSVSSVTIVKEPTHINVKDLITVYKWLPQLCNMATFLPIFTDIIKDGQVLLEDVPQFDKLMYRVMGE
jgi:hypothetical protein